MIAISCLNRLLSWERNPLKYLIMLKNSINFDRRIYSVVLVGKSLIFYSSVAFQVNLLVIQTKDQKYFK